MPSEINSPSENDENNSTVATSISGGEHERTRGPNQARQPSLNRREETIKERTFSGRALLAGALIGAMICFANLYFGLQAGLNNSMPLPSALLGYAIFQPISKYLHTPYSPMENVLVMTVASSMGGMPVTAGLDGIIPALEFLISPKENGPLTFSLWRLILWSLGVCLFGIVFAAPLRYYFVVRDPLRFPTGTAMAVVIGLLHKRPDISDRISQDQAGKYEVHGKKSVGSFPETEEESLEVSNDDEIVEVDDEDHNDRGQRDDRREVPLSNHLGPIVAFSVSGLAALLFYFIPSLEKLPIFGIPAARDWVWALNPSPAYFGYGMIIRPITTAHMLLGAIVGWGILSPLAKKKGWAPGPVDQWQGGAQGWIIWIALGILLGDSVVGISWIFIRPLLPKPAKRDSFIMRLKTILGRPFTSESMESPNESSSQIQNPDERTPLLVSDNEAHAASATLFRPLDDAPKDQRLSDTAILCWLAGISLLCFFTTWFLFGHLLSVGQIILAIILIPPLGMASIRAMGETDNSLASSLGKVSQFLFALVIPVSNPSAIIISLLVGGIAEGGIYQSSDVMEHLKTGHLVGASPKDLFYGQVIGSSVGAILASCVYKLYTSVYNVPSEQFRVPQAQLWLATARLVYGRGLPDGVWPFVVVAFVLSFVSAVSRIALENWRWKDQIPSGIAIGIGLYVLPAYTLPQAMGGLAHWYCRSRLNMEELPMITIASGFILGQGVFNIVNLLLSAQHVPHF